MIRPGMGTEYSSELLAALVRMTRPRNILEIGAGDSTRHLALALQQAKEDWKADRKRADSPLWEERTSLIDPGRLPATYDPRLFTVDDFSDPSTSAEAAWQALRGGGVQDGIVQFIKADFHRLGIEELRSFAPLDLAWIDAGTPADDVRFVSTLWDMIEPGGLICFHEPMMATTVELDGSVRVRQVRTPVWEELLSRLDQTFEVLTIPEPFKYRQAGIGVLRKRPASEFGFRKTSLQEELRVLGELPIRSNILGVGMAEIKRSAMRSAVHGAMASEASRTFFSAVVLGAQSVSEVRQKTGHDAKTAAKTLSRLQTIGLVTVKDGRLSHDSSIWTRLSEADERRRTILSDKNLEEPKLADQIVTAFRPGVRYTETEVSAVCALFTEDYARLRRFLIDTKRLKRDHGVYERSTVDA